jgi:hypothetical protein
MMDEKKIKPDVKKSRTEKVDTVKTVKLDHYIEIKGLNQYDAALLHSQPDLRAQMNPDVKWDKILADLQKKPITK